MRTVSKQKYHPANGNVFQLHFTSFGDSTANTLIYELRLLPVAVHEQIAKIDKHFQRTFTFAFAR